MGTGAVSETKLQRRKAERRTREPVSRPGAWVARQDLGRVAEPAISREHRLDEAAVRIRLRRIVAAAHVDLDVTEAMLLQVRFELGERVRGGHVGDEAHVELRGRAVRQDGLTTRSRVAPDQTFN